MLNDHFTWAISICWLQWQILRDANPQSSSVIQATINSAHETEKSAQTGESNEIVGFNALDEADLDVEDLAHLSEQAKVLERKK